MHRSGLLMILITVSCFGANRGLAGTTEFNGGTLSSLMALSPTLTFDELVISGPLEIPAGSSANLRVNRLTITAGGSVGRSYSDCQYGPAPGFTVEATGEVAIHGPISLTGRPGTRVTDFAVCDECGGCAGGSVRIAGNNVTVTAGICTDGGSGSTLVSTYGSSGCGGGAAGPIYLEATNQLVLDGATVESEFGVGGTGHMFGNENHGADGAASEVRLISHNALQMTHSTVTSSGTVVLQAQQASIWGPITGQLQETIHGQGDSTPPTLEILAPGSGQTVYLDAPLEIRVAAQDAGAGIKEVKVTGFGHNQVHSGTELEGGVLTITLPLISPPYQIEVTATDNKGLSTTNRVSNFVLRGNLLIPPATFYSLGTDLSLGPTARVDIKGAMMIPLGSNVTLSAGTLVVAPGGSITAVAPRGSASRSQTSSLTVNLNGNAVIRGMVNFSGIDSLSYDKGQDGGEFILEASDIEHYGEVRANGGNGQTYSVGGKGGHVRLSALNRLEVEGMITVRGGHTDNPDGGPCQNGGMGGAIELRYGTEQNLSQAMLLVAGGDATANSWTCSSARPGASGVVLTTYTGAWPAAQVLDLAERESNGYRTNAQFIPLMPARVSAMSNPSEAGEYYYPSPWVIQDFYQFGVTLNTNTVVGSSNVIVELAWDAQTDLDLLLIDPDVLTILGKSQSASGQSESVTSQLLPLDSYWIGVQSFDSTVCPYALTVRYADQPRPGWPPDRSTNQSPANGATGVSLTPTLQASSFHDQEPADTHLYSHWLVCRNSDDALVFDSGWDGAHKGSLALPSGILAPSTEYRWRVSYSDNQRMWSRFSDPTVFTTAATASSGPRFVGCRRSGANSIALDLESEVGRVLEIHASSNLVSWSWVATLTNTTGTVQFNEAVPPNIPARYYRAWQKP